MARAQNDVSTHLATATSTRAFAATYYVSPGGNDAAAGTSAGTAWQTINKVNGRSFGAGDRICFQGGQTFSGNLTFGSDDTGTAVNPITVGS